ncbi:MAG: hypothetical protein OEZ44_05695 [Candidatus Bathyarchaeota archaeon]|nr:hypothetical protein [Candidatus Bathyarchaeota archaeon]
MRSRLIIVLTLTLFLAAAPYAFGQEQYSPRELTFVVYQDGYVAVDYYVDVDPTKARVNVTIFGSQCLDLMVEDQDGLPLDSSQHDSVLTIDTLGSASVLISYVTMDLTGKSGQIWSLMVETPVSSVIFLPVGVTIVSLSTVPLAMGSIDGGLLITMPVGDLLIEYKISLVGTREHALLVIKDAESTIQEVKTGGIITDEADGLLQQATQAFEAGNYTGAEQLAGQAKASALNTKNAAASASAAMDAAETAITAAEQAGRTVGLEEAESLLEQAEASYASGEYAEAKALAEQAQSKAASAETPEKEGLPFFWIGIILVVVVAGVFAFLRMRKPVPRAALKYSFDLDALFDAHPYLRLDDKEVLRFLADAGGEAFAAEIRDRFDVPRTSLWRMIRRLEGEGIVDVETIGGQSLVRISPKYRSGGAEA